MKKANSIRNVVFILAIVILYIPMVQLAVTTFIPRTEAEEYSYKDCAAPRPVLEGEMSEEERRSQEACFAEQRELEQQRQNVRKQRDTIRFIVAALISFVTVALAAFLGFDMVINYGLFSAAVLNILFSLRFSVDKSVTGLVILAVLFVTSIVFIRRQLKKPASK